MSYEKTPYARKRRPAWGITPRVVIVALVIVFLLLCLVGRGTFSRIGCSNRASALKSYIDETKRLADRTNAMGRDFNDLRVNIKTTSRKDLEKGLDKLIKESKTLTEDSRKVSPPDDMEKAHLYLILAFELRAAALERFKPAIFNALTDKDLEVAANQVSLALKDFTLSDHAFGLFHEEAQKVLDQNKVSYVSAPSSTFLPAGTEYEIENVLEFLKELQGVSSLSELHGLGVAEITVKPAPKSELQGVSTLPYADSVSATITVENQGNQVEINIPVKVTLKSETQPKAQEVTKSLGSVNPGQKKAITITGLKATPGDIMNLLTVSVGPVPNEKFLENNTLEFKFIMENK